MKRYLNVLLMSFLFCATTVYAQYQMEYLDRGVIAMRRTSDNYISWRMLGTESMNVSYNIYRNGTKINSTPITTSTNYVDAGGNTSSTYQVTAIVNGVEGAKSKSVDTWATFYKELSLNTPAGGTTPDGVVYDYSPNDATVADLDGDGEYEIIFKWYPSNAKDNAHDGYTGVTYIEAIKLNGTRMWRIDLGKNIRSGAHYVEMQVYDFDGDGKAEVALRTADGTIDGKGKVIGSATADYRSSVGRVLSGPEFLTIFNGMTGAEMSTVNYVPGRGKVSDWGDNYGNRVDRFLSGVAHLGGAGNPSLLMCRGYYTRMVVAAWDFVGGKLVQRWVFDTNQGKTNLAGKGNHQISVADVDGDGKQEVIYGAVVIDDNGSVLNSNTWWHGDALHCGDFDLSNPGLEIFEPTETGKADASLGQPGFVMRDAKTGKVLWAKYMDGDIGRGICANIDSRYPGAECWASGGAGLYDAKGNVIGNTPSGCNHTIWWDGDLTRELLDGTKLDKWDQAWDGGKGGNSRMLTIYNYAGASSNNGTKSNPNLTADIFGDWREEMIYRNNTNDKLIIFSTNYSTTHKMPTLMHDAQYRAAIAWQSTGYNQPPHPSFYIGEDMSPAPTPNITIVGTADCKGIRGGIAYLDQCGVCVGGTTGLTPCIVDCNGTKDGSATLDQCGICSGGTTGKIACNAALQGEAFCSGDGVLESTNLGFQGTGYYNFANAVGSKGTWNLVSNSAQSVQIGVRFSNGGTTARGMNVLVNGVQKATLVGNTTTSWTTWNVENMTLSLVSGVNSIQLVSTSADRGPNLDLFVLPSQVSAGGCVADCKGVIGGVAFVDSCGKCVGGTTGLNACTKDCKGTWGGTSYADDCGVCIGGTTDLKPCAKSLEAELACDVIGVLNESSNAGYLGTGYVNTDNVLGSSVSWVVNSTSTQSATISFRYANGGAESRDGNLVINGKIVSTLLFPSTGSWTTWKIASVNVNFLSGVNNLSIQATSGLGLANLDALYFSAGVTDANCVVTGVDQFNVLSIDVYPNPTTGVLNLSKSVAWELSNALGTKLQSGETNEIDLNQYPAGVYFIQFNNQQVKVVKR